jgi:hypothetical protein
MNIANGRLICAVGLLSLSGCATPPVKCGGEDPHAVFFPAMVGAGKNAHIENGVLTFTGVFGFPKNEAISFPVRRPASYVDDPRCVGPDGTGGLWMSSTPGENLSFFILPGRSGGGVQVNQLLPK